jgi:hypothetical protein
VSHQNNSGLFPNLENKYAALLKHANSWAEQIGGMGFHVQSVRLFNATPTMGFEYHGKEYIVAFEIADWENPPKSEKVRAYQHVLEGYLEDPEGILWNSNLFREVDDKWRDSWVFRVGVPEGVDKEFCWVLYDSTEGLEAKGAADTPKQKKIGFDTERLTKKKDYRTKQWEKAIPIARQLYKDNDKITLEEIKNDPAFKACFKEMLSDDRIRDMLNEAGIKLAGGRRNKKPR